MRITITRILFVAFTASLVLSGQSRQGSADETRERLETIRDGYLANRTSFKHGTCRFRFAHWSADSEADALMSRPNNRRPRISLIYKMLFRDDILIVAPDYESEIVQHMLQTKEETPPHYTYARNGKFAVDEYGLIVNSIIEDRDTTNRLTLHAHPFALAQDADVNPAMEIDYAQRKNFEGIEFTVEDAKRDGHNYLLLKTRSVHNSHDSNEYIDPKRGYLNFVTELTNRKTGEFYSRMFLTEVREDHGRYFPMHAICVRPRIPLEGRPYVSVRQMEVLELDLEHVPTDEELVVPMHRETQYSDGINPNTALTIFRSSKEKYVKVPVHDLEKTYNDLQLLAIERLEGDKLRLLKFVTPLIGEGEFVTHDEVHRRALLALNEEDVQNWWREITPEQRGKLESELKPFLDLSRAFANEEKHRNYVLAHFNDIKHPTLKLLWAGLLFEKEQRSQEIIDHLKTALESEQNVKFLTEQLGSDWSEINSQLP